MVKDSTPPVRLLVPPALRQRVTGWVRRMVLTLAMAFLTLGGSSIASQRATAAGAVAEAASTTNTPAAALAYRSMETRQARSGGSFSRPGIGALSRIDTARAESTTGTLAAGVSLDSIAGREAGTQGAEPRNGTIASTQPAPANVSPALALPKVEAKVIVASALVTAPPPAAKETARMAAPKPQVLTEAFVSTTKATLAQVDLRPADTRYVAPRSNEPVSAAPLVHTTKSAEPVSHGKQPDLLIHSWKAEVASCPWNESHHCGRPLGRTRPFFHEAGSGIPAQREVVARQQIRLASTSYSRKAASTMCVAALDKATWAIW